MVRELRGSTAAPVFVVTHHPRPALEMEGGTVSHFVDGSPQEVLDRMHIVEVPIDDLIGLEPATDDAVHWHRVRR